MSAIRRRLEQLEQTFGGRREPLEIVHQIVSPSANGPVYEPMLAWAARAASPTYLHRRAGETVAAFEMRALEHFRSGVCTSIVCGPAEEGPLSEVIGASPQTKRD